MHAVRPDDSVFPAGIIQQAFVKFSAQERQSELFWRHAARYLYESVYYDTPGIWFQDKPYFLSKVIADIAGMFRDNVRPGYTNSLAARNLRRKDMHREKDLTVIFLWLDSHEVLIEFLDIMQQHFTELQSVPFRQQYGVILTARIQHGVLEIFEQAVRRIAAEKQSWAEVPDSWMQHLYLAAFLEEANQTTVFQDFSQRLIDYEKSEG